MTVFSPRDSLPTTRSSSDLRPRVLVRSGTGPPGPEPSDLSDLLDEEVLGGAPSILDVRIRFAPSLPVVRLSGELDLGSVHLLTDALEAIAAAHCPVELVLLDLADVTFCDVAGLRGIERCGATLTSAGRELVLYHVPNCVERLMKLTGVASGLGRR